MSRGSSERVVEISLLNRSLQQWSDVDWTAEFSRVSRLLNVPHVGSTWRDHERHSSSKDHDTSRGEYELVLNAHHNRLTNLVNFPVTSLQSSLIELNLSSNHFTTFLNLTELSRLPHLQRLDLSGNHIQSFHGLPFLPSLQELLLSANQLNSFFIIPPLESVSSVNQVWVSTILKDSLPSLVSLDLRYNCLGDSTGHVPYEVQWQWIARELSGLSTLKTLQVEGNPFIPHETQHVHRCLRILAEGHIALQHIDGIAISSILQEDQYITVQHTPTHQQASPGGVPQQAHHELWQSPHTVSTTIQHSPSTEWTVATNCSPIIPPNNSSTMPPNMPPNVPPEWNALVAQMALQLAAAARNGNLPPNTNSHPQVVPPQSMPPNLPPATPLPSVPQTVVETPRIDALLRRHGRHTSVNSQVPEGNQNNSLPASVSSPSKSPKQVVNRPSCPMDEGDSWITDGGTSLAGVSLIGGAPSNQLATGLSNESLLALLMPPSCDVSVIAMTQADSVLSPSVSGQIDRNEHQSPVKEPSQSSGHDQPCVKVICEKLTKVLSSVVERTQFRSMMSFFYRWRLVSSIAAVSDELMTNLSVTEKRAAVAEEEAAKLSKKLEDMLSTPKEVIITQDNSTSTTDTFPNVTEEELKQLRDEVHKMREVSESMNEELTRQVLISTDATDKLTAAEETIILLRSQLVEARMAVETAQERQALAISSAEMEKSAREEMRHLLNEYRQNLDTARQATEEARKEAKALVEQISLDSTNTESHKQQLSLLQSSLEESNTERRRLESRLQKATATLEAIAQERDSAIGECQTLKEGQRRDRAAIKELGRCIEKLQSVTTSNNANCAAEASAEVSRLSSELMTANDIIKKLRKELSSVRESKELCEKRLHELEMDVVNLKTAKGESETALAVSNVVTRDQIAEIASLRQKLSAASEELRIQRKTATTHDASQQAIIDELTAELVSCEERLERRGRVEKRLRQIVRQYVAAAATDDAFASHPDSALRRSVDRFLQETVEESCDTPLDPSQSMKDDIGDDLEYIANHLGSPSGIAFSSLPSIQPSSTEPSVNPRSNPSSINKESHFCQNEACAHRRSEYERLLGEAYDLLQAQKKEFGATIAAKSVECENMAQALTQLEENTSALEKMFATDRKHMEESLMKYRSERKQLRKLCAALENELAARDAKLRDIGLLSNLNSRDSQLHNT